MDGARRHSRTTKQAEERHAGLLATVAKLRDVFGTTWDSFELVRPVSGRLRSGIFESKVDRLMGPRVPFERVQRKTSQPLDSDSLYLLPVHEARALKLMPLVKIMPAPRTAQNACYFYNRTQKDQQIRFVSYHFEQRSRSCRSIQGHSRNPSADFGRPTISKSYIPQIREISSPASF